ncbi:hypothetical protein Pint_21660 [Pistacia integerrima]|uniref:Uncharacterized protein n=1 Tax=Pistacia integerrima TaxID=434235 RepID=A0ACC0XC20_9ROSI|nr:hypothetical protein Pint_21660 [Pistacia integerrima]
MEKIKIFSKGSSEFREEFLLLLLLCIVRVSTSGNFQQPLSMIAKRLHKIDLFNKWDYDYSSRNDTNEWLSAFPSLVVLKSFFSCLYYLLFRSRNMRQNAYLEWLKQDRSVYLFTRVLRVHGYAHVIRLLSTMVVLGVFVSLYARSHAGKKFFRDENRVALIISRFIYQFTTIPRLPPTPEMVLGYNASTDAIHCWNTLIIFSLVGNVRILSFWSPGARVQKCLV